MSGHGEQGSQEIDGNRPCFNRHRRTVEVNGKPKGKGHEVVLKALKEGGRMTTIITMAGEEHSGLVVGFDKFTITLLIDTGHMPAQRREVFYKHGIERFYGDEAPVDREQ